MNEHEVVAKTLWGEARGEGLIGLYAVGCVIRNRYRKPGWWGRGWAGVCMAPKQFSCWNLSDPNAEKLAALAPGDDELAAAWLVATDIMFGGGKDITNGATHYCTKAVSPAWAKGVKPVAAIGNHVFYIVP